MHWIWLESTFSVSRRFAWALRELAFLTFQTTVRATKSVFHILQSADKDLTFFQRVQNREV